jgi:hypothetical protein
MMILAEILSRWLNAEKRAALDWAGTRTARSVHAAAKIHYTNPKKCTSQVRSCKNLLIKYLENGVGAAETASRHIRCHEGNNYDNDKNNNDHSNNSVPVSRPSSTAKACNRRAQQ